MTTPTQLPPDDLPPVIHDTQPCIWVAFDIDTTLHDTHGKPRWDIIHLLWITSQYARIIVWSTAGATHAAHHGRHLHLPDSIYYASKLNHPHTVDLTYDTQDTTLGKVNIRV